MIVSVLGYDIIVQNLSSHMIYFEIYRCLLKDSRFSIPGKRSDRKVKIEMFWSRAAQALAPRVGVCKFDIGCNLNMVI